MESDNKVPYIIHAPAVRYDDIEILAREGAYSFYMGYISRSKDRSASPPGINRRPYRHANVETRDEFEAMVKKAHGLGRKTVFCANETYDENGLEQILTDVEWAVSAGVDQIIVADLGLIALLRSRFPNTGLILSTVGTVMNHFDAEFFSELGVATVTLVRHLLIEEIKDIAVRCSGMEFIVFIYGSKCPNIDGYCSFHHGFIEREKSMMFKAFNTPVVRRIMERVPVPEVAAVRMKRAILQNDLGCSMAYKTQALLGGPDAPLPDWSFFHTLECGLCAIWDFFHAGIRTFKIVGREHPLKKRIERVRLTRMALDRLVQNPDCDRDAFRRFCRDLTKTALDRNCRRCDCYYPEAFC